MQDLSAQNKIKMEFQKDEQCNKVDMRQEGSRFHLHQPTMHENNVIPVLA